MQNLTLDTAPARSGTPVDWTSVEPTRRRRVVASAFVDRDATTLIINKIDQIREFRRDGAEPRCIILTGLPGVGKTTLLKHYASMHPGRTESGVKIRPVLYVCMQSRTSPIGAAKIMLAELMGPNHTAGTQTELTFRVKDQLRRQQVEVVLNDEFQHVAEKGQAKTVSDAADWVKEVVKDTTVPFAMAGMSTVTRLVEQNQQLNDITPYRYELGRFGYESEPEKLAFRKFLQKLDHAFPFNIPAHLGEPRTAHALFAVTEGNLRRLATVLFIASTKAINRNAPMMTTDDLAAGVDDIHLENPLRDNPFRNADLWHLL
jgi:GTPase SAR1 family protein